VEKAVAALCRDLGDRGGAQRRSILAFGDEVEPQKALWPALFGVLVPAAVYCVGWVWERLTKN
jgi:hypothetical protein